MEPDVVFIPETMGYPPYEFRRNAGGTYDMYQLDGTPMSGLYSGLSYAQAVQFANWQAQD